MRPGIRTATGPGCRGTAPGIWVAEDLQFGLSGGDGTPPRSQHVFPRSVHASKRPPRGPVGPFARMSADLRSPEIDPRSASRWTPRSASRSAPRCAASTRGSAHGEHHVDDVIEQQVDLPFGVSAALRGERDGAHLVDAELGALAEERLEAVAEVVHLVLVVADPRGPSRRKRRPSGRPSRSRISCADCRASPNQALSPLFDGRAHALGARRRPRVARERRRPGRSSSRPSPSRRRRDGSPPHRCRRCRWERRTHGGRP